MPKFKDSQELREQIVNIIDDLVDRIAPGYLLPNPYFRFDYRMAIYENFYKSLWREFGRRRSKNVDYRDEVFDFLREVPSANFFIAIEHLLKVMCQGVYIQRAIPDDIIPNPSAGNERWSRKESDRDRHIKLFKDAVDDINDRILKNNSKCLYTLERASIQLVRLDTGLDVPEKNNDIQGQNDNQTPAHDQNQKDSDIQELDDNQIPEHHQNQSRSELWNRRNFIIGVLMLFFTAVGVLFGTGILIPSLRWVWNHLQPILKNITTWFAQMRIL